MRGVGAGQLRENALGNYEFFEFIFERAQGELIPLMFILVFGFIFLRRA